MVSSNHTRKQQSNDYDGNNLIVKYTLNSKADQVKIIKYIKLFFKLFLVERF